MNGYVYLLHFTCRIHPDRPTQHYIGWSNDIDVRIRQHRKGYGSRLCQIAKERKIGFQVAELWLGDRHFERWLKSFKQASRFCPVCQNQRQSAASAAAIALNPRGVFKLIL